MQLRRPKYVRHLVNSGGLSSHKHFGDPSCRKNHQYLTLSSPLYTHRLRQQLRHRGHTEAGFESFQDPGTGRDTFPRSQTPEHRAHSYSRPRPPQRRHRCTIANPIGKHRVRALPIGVQQAVPDRDTTGHRSLCLPSKPQAPSIHVPISASQGLFNRRFHGRLEHLGGNLLFRPVNLLLRVASNQMTFLGRALIIIPWRPTAPWFPALRPRSSIHNLLEPSFQIV